MKTPSEPKRPCARVTFSDTEDPQDSPYLTKVTLAKNHHLYGTILRTAADQLDKGHDLEIRLYTRNAQS